jgi:hypothetical protein
MDEDRAKRVARGHNSFFNPVYRTKSYHVVSLCFTGLTKGQSSRGEIGMDDTHVQRI